MAAWFAWAPDLRVDAHPLRLAKDSLTAVTGGLLHQLLPAARLGVLPRFGPGTEVMSWISLSDEVAAIRFLLDHGDLSGPVNLTAPGPVTNSAFTAALDHVLHRPSLPWLRAPAWLLRAALGEGIGEVLINARVTPRRLQEAGYQFRSPTLPEALSAKLPADQSSGTTRT